MVRLEFVLQASFPTEIRGGVSKRQRCLSTMLGRIFIFTRFLVVATFSVAPAFGTHQLSNVEKRHHELGAQRNELFAEMQELLRQQEEDVASCKAALATMSQKAEAAEAVASSAGVCGNPSRDHQASPPPASPDPKDEIPTITGAKGFPRDNGELGEEDKKRLIDKESVDFANYFCSYAELDHQKQMLEDERRMEAYQNAMLQNKDFFKGKTVLDVGAGSGVLAIFAAQAGAKKVYAVEYTDMAKHAERLVEDNGFGDVIMVMQDSAESMELPEKVDVIVSEWMGYFLLRESMLDSVVVARDKWLKDDGVMFPSHARMVWALVTDEEEKNRKDRNYESSLQSWSSFVKDAKGKYGLDMGGLNSAYDTECQEYYSLTSAWRDLSTDQVLSQPIVVKELDLHTCTLSDTKGLAETPFSFVLGADDSPATGFAGWFDVSFRGREGVALLQRPVEFSTSPDAGYTHWGQQVFQLEKAVYSRGNGEIFPITVDGTVSMVRQAANPRLYNIKVRHRRTFGAPEGAMDEAEIVSTVYKLS